MYWDLLSEVGRTAAAGSYTETALLHEVHNAQQLLCAVALQQSGQGCVSKEHSEADRFTLAGGPSLKGKAH